MEAGKSEVPQQRPPVKTWRMHKLTHRGEKLQNPKALQCYNYTSFFLLGKHKGGDLISLPAHILLCLPLLSSPPLATQTDERALISPWKKSCGSTTSASHTAVIVSAVVGGSGNKDGGGGRALPFTERGFVRISGERRSSRSWTWCDSAPWWTDSERAIRRLAGNDLGLNCCEIMY